MAGRFKALGKEYELATIDSLSFDEAREVKRISGLNIGPMYRALAETDPEAWLALFTVSIQRVEATFNELRLAEANVLEMVASLPVEDDAVPPSEGAKAPESESETEPAPAAEDGPSAGAGESEEHSSSAPPASQNGKGSEGETLSSDRTTSETPGVPSS